MHTLGDYKGPATRAWPRAPGLSLESHNWTNTTTQCLDTERVWNALSFLSAVWVWFWFNRCLGRGPGAGVTRGARLQPAVLSISSPRTNPDIYHATNFSSNTCPTKLAHNRRRTEVARNFHIQLNKLYLSVCVLSRNIIVSRAEARASVPPPCWKNTIRICNTNMKIYYK